MINVVETPEQYDINNLPLVNVDSEIQNSSIKSKHATLDELGRLSKQQLIMEVIKASIEAEREKRHRNNKNLEVKNTGGYKYD